MYQTRENPASGKLAGLENSQRAAVNVEPYSTTGMRQPDFAATYLARKYRLTPCAARVIAVLAGLGGRLA